MPSYPLNEKGYQYRPLKQGQRGWDVYALQTALADAGFPLGDFDGIFGPATHRAVCGYQESRALTSDGIAGTVTQRSLALREAWNAQRKYKLPSGSMKGQVEAESAFLLGNHSPVYGEGWYDVGVTQRATRYTAIGVGFNSPASLEALAKQVRTNYDLYKSYGKVTNERRLWELAMGSWNAPAWTNTLAKGGTLKPEQKAWIEDYVDRVTVYLSV